MGVLIGIIGPVFALIGMGALAMRLRLLEVVALKGMTDFVFFAAMPSLLFLSIGGAPPLRLVDVAGSFLAGALLLFAMAVFLGKYVLRVGLAASGVFALNCVFISRVLSDGFTSRLAGFGPTQSWVRYQPSVLSALGWAQYWYTGTQRSTVWPGAMVLPK